ncbi:mechanosensitive ion channel family protein [Rhizobium sp. FKY42]|uniref:mechanosensitive ion channel family protein n=1 Tax=Rhizobium sp. FKY42 TaxID=2562310 RepID=UPI0010C06EA1|nr:mechanosensitive ion channel family protein [Rhizobium sp. FKY42]
MTLVLVGSPSGSLAQSAPEAAPAAAAGASAAPKSKTQTTITEAKKALGSITARSNAQGVDDMQLAELKAQADDLVTRLSEHLGSLKQRLDQINARVKELGEPPQDGQPPEAAVVTEERSRLAAERGELTAFSSELGQISNGAKELSAKITEQRRRLFSDVLLKHTDLSWGMLADAGSTFWHEVDTFQETMASWLSFAWKFKKLQLVGAVFLSIGAALFFLAGGYRMLGKMVKRDPAIDNPPYITRLSFAFWSLVLQTFSLSAFMLATFFFMDSFGVLRPDIRPLVGTFLGFIWVVVFVARLSYLVLGPEHPHWRLIRLSNRGAKVLFWLILAMALINGLDFALTEVSEALNSPVVLSIAKSLIASVLIGVILLAMSFLKPVLAEDRDPDAPGRSWPRGFPLALRALGIALLLAALSGYVGLARFFSTQIVLTGALVATGYIGILSGKAVGKQGAFASTSVGKYVAVRFKSNEIILDQIGLVAGLSIYAFSVIIVVPVILLTWGFQTQDIKAAAIRLLTQISIGNINISLIGILVGVLLFMVGYLVTRFAQRWIDRNVMARSQVDAGVRNSVKTGIGYLGMGLAVVIGVSAAGIDLSSLALVASALSVGIGFGLQNIVSNFVSGLILLVERPFKVGDHIITGTTEGIVKRISVRATEIETFRKQSIIVPNSDLINAAVGNWTHRNRMQRSEIPVGVAYGTDPRRVIELLLELAGAVPQILRNPEPHVEFLRFGASSLDFELRFHVADISDGMNIRNALRAEILRRFEEEGIEIPYTKQDINVHGTLYTMRAPASEKEKQYEPKDVHDREAGEAPAS